MNKFIYGLFTAAALLVAGLTATALPADARPQTNVTITLGNAQFGYHDGYYDNQRRWHRWQNNRQRTWYQRNHGRTYYQMRRDNDRDRYRRDWRNGRRNDWRGYRH
jgi:hypothetical protein